MLKVILPSHDDNLRLGVGLLGADIHVLRSERPLQLDLRAIQAHIRGYRLPFDFVLFRISAFQTISTQFVDAGLVVDLPTSVLDELIAEEEVEFKVHIGQREVSFVLVSRPDQNLCAEIFNIKLSIRSLNSIFGRVPSKESTIRQVLADAFSSRKNWVFASRLGEDLIGYLFTNVLKDNPQVRHMLSYVPDVGTLNFTIVPMSLLSAKDLAEACKRWHKTAISRDNLEEEFVQVRLIPVGIGQELGSLLAWIYQSVWETAIENLSQFLAEHLPTIEEMRTLEHWLFLNLLVFRKYTIEQAVAITIYREQYAFKNSCT